MTNTTANESPRPELLITRAVTHLRATGDSSFFRLKRGTTLLDAMLEPIFHQVKETLHQYDYFWISDEQLACALLLLSVLPEQSNSAFLAQSLGKHKYNQSRFRRLITCDDIADLHIQLLRALRYCKFEVSALNVSKIVIQWNEPTISTIRKQMTADFFKYSPK